MKKLYLAFLGSLMCCLLYAQPEMPMPEVPLRRQLFHDNIDNAQKAILKLGGSRDNIFIATSDIDVNLQVTQLLKVRVNNMQVYVESDSSIRESDKYTWLRGINDMLTDFISLYKLKVIRGIQLGDLIIAYDEAMHAQIHQRSIQPIVQNNEIEVGTILVQNFALQDNKGIRSSKDALVLKLCQHNPDKILFILSKHVSVPFADSLITVMAYRNPEELYNFAVAQDSLARKIKSVQEPFVKTISKMASVKSGRFLFPFLDDIYHKKINIDSIAQLVDDEEGYYKLLVRTQINYATRARHGDTPYVMHVLTEKLRAKAIETYINEINALHEEKSDAVRFKKINNLSPTELYYLCVLGEEDIYTSSYLGVYKRIFQRMKMPRSDSLLMAVDIDYYKKFIKMAAAYNVLDDFLQRMDHEAAEVLMKNFAHGLEGTTTLEDAVDVADSYAGIEDPALKKLILDQVQTDLKKNIQQGNKRGQTIYNLLNTIFLSMDSTNKIDVSATLGIPPVYFMTNKLLQDTTSGKIIIQQFFYGDKDGMGIFNSFLNNYRNSNWKITIKDDWAEVASVKGTPVVIYSNKALDTEKDLDKKAQYRLDDYLDSLGLSPGIVIHRGHSYYVNETISQLSTSAKVVLLGGCGGYHSLNEVLSICPQAQIIASKQVGTGIVNIALILAITETLRQGKDLNWPTMWKGLETKFNGTAKEKFDDYVPPHKNLGAIFIMAYKKLSKS